ncbi:hypothetical protein LOTGIDRAFT_166818 [Lottia gigantea]|uniref:Uncharacterized protein n=1 Tax=Lottia gigantea TaxID=225164 RepID=V3ZW29_LOTGI|nr:hypothetical protein LOTGIDRAFT_166818 [Lottia gigantea]ESO86815.1 hypothetical protein LOTGIDRAFT_166818 [Lottia gigantea]
MSALNLIRKFRLQTTPNVAKLSRIWTTRGNSDDSNKSKSADVEKKSARSSLRWKLDPSKRLEFMLGEPSGKLERNVNSESMKDSPEFGNSPQNNPVKSPDHGNKNAKNLRRELDPSTRLESMLGEQNVKIDNINVEFERNGKVESMKDQSEAGIPPNNNSITYTGNIKFTSNENKSGMEKSVLGNSETSSQFFSSEPKSENLIQGSSEPSTEDKAKFFASRTARRSKLSPLQRYSWMIENADDNLKERLESDIDESLKDLKKLADNVKNKD